MGQFLIYIYFNVFLVALITYTPLNDPICLNIVSCPFLRPLVNNTQPVAYLLINTQNS